MTQKRNLVEIHDQIYRAEMHVLAVNMALASLGRNKEVDALQHILGDCQELLIAVRCNLDGAEKRAAA